MSDENPKIVKPPIGDSRLPADLKASILADLPSDEEQERLYRQMQEQGGIPPEQFLESLGLSNGANSHV
ncbi:MAG: hypothetical protein FJ271_02840 [Planctomycetes bacterium]|nr:hypothetical protein [Planctomycetota bacterium]